MALPSAYFGLILLFALLAVAFSANRSEVYIVYMGSKPQSVHPHKLSAAHHDMLATVFGSVDAAKESIIYSYSRSFNGFAAKLEPEQAAKLEEMPDVFSVFKDQMLQPQTTHSWSFLGLEDNYGNIPSNSLWKNTLGDDIVIGVVDSGIWPEAASFSDKGITGPLPNKWKGTCATGPSFSPSNCNNKLIGAKFYYKGYVASYGPLDPNEIKSSRDVNGHGTSVASIAVGNYAPGANYLGFASGTAKGGAPRARLAVYKNCWVKSGQTTCSAADALAAMDEAIADGVNIINLSQGTPGGDPSPLYKQPMAIGAYHAVQAGIVVVAACGNSGPTQSTVDNVAPWLITVGASSIDRNFPRNVVLGNGNTYAGYSWSNVNLNGFYPLVYGGDIPSSSTKNLTLSGECMNGSLDASKARGKIVLCEISGGVTPNAKAEVVKAAGGVGIIVGNGEVGRERLFGFEFSTPATQVGRTARNAILAYIRSSRNPTASLTPPATTLGYQPAPKVGVFSSQGPNKLIPDLLKPDVVAPGVDILAAWSEAPQPVHKYFMAFGTSFASPHVAGISALLKSLHPDWTPAIIRSALMTTATTTDNSGQSILDGDLAVATPFQVGTGNVNPNAATDPGLAYNTTEDDYIRFLCTLGYSAFDVQKITGKPSICSKLPTVSDFNYPSVTISNLRGRLSITRTLTSVFDSPSTYDIYINSPQGVTVAATPLRLTFSGKGDSQSFRLDFTVKPGYLPSQYVYGDFIWSDGMHQVRSPLVVKATSIKVSADEELHATT